MNAIYTRTVDAGVEDSFVAPCWYPGLHTWIANPESAENCSYNYALPLRILGPVEPAVLEKALQQLASRHQVLRSRFRLRDDEVVQVIDRSAAIELAVEDVASAPAAEIQAARSRVLVNEANRSFDLRSSPLLRAVLVRSDSNEHVLMLVTHHAVVDDWSTGILIHELSVLYRALRSGEAAGLDAPGFQYSDFVRWQERRFQTGRLAQYIAFWKQQLANAGNFHHLLPDHARPAAPGFRGAHAVADIPEPLTGALVALARRERATPYMVLVTAFQCLLHQYSGEEDIGVASCVANRNLLETEALVGPLSNRVVIRTDFSGQPTLLECLRRTRAEMLSTNPYEDLPFGCLVKHLQPAVPAGQNALFQVLMILQNAPRPQSENTGLQLQPLSMDTETTRYDLNVWLTLEKSLKVDLQYNTALFDQSTMRQVLNDYAAVLEALATNCHLRAGEIPMAGDRRGAVSRAG